MLRVEFADYNECRDIYDASLTGRHCCFNHAAGWHMMIILIGLPDPV